MWKVMEILRLRWCTAQSIKSESSRIQNDFWRNRITFNITFYKREISFLILCYLHEIRFHLITCRCCVFITSIKLLSQTSYFLPYKTEGNLIQEKINIPKKAIHLVIDLVGVFLNEKIECVFKVSSFFTCQVTKES